MARYYPNWLKAFMDYCRHGEAPSRMYFWVGVSTIAGALERKVWIDQAYFKWFPNFYIILVAPPGIVSKSTTAGIGMDLLRAVPGINFGPDVVTWPALIQAFEEACVSFDVGEDMHLQSALTIESSEFGNLLDPDDRPMVDLLVTLWDGKQLDKRTKTSGCNVVKSPWINLIACTTPAWIAGNFPDYMIGGGFMSRCVFVFADEKERYVAYPCRQVSDQHSEIRQRLISDLEWISLKLRGEYKLSDEAYEWGDAWYKHHYQNRPPHLDDERFGGYIARKQTHIHKLAMILSASESDDLIIQKDTLILANTMTSDLENDMTSVFSKIGKTETANHADKLVWYVQKRGGAPYTEVYRFMHGNFPSVRDFEDVLAGCVRAGYIKLEQRGDQIIVSPVEAL